MQRRSASHHDRKNVLTSPVWSVTAPPGPKLASLSGRLEAEVLVIGGGIAGMTTALHLAEKGVDVVLVEAGQPGDGATGQSGGLVAPDYIRHSPESVQSTFGEDAGGRLTRMIGSSARQVFDLIDRLRIDCDARQDGFYTPSHTDALAEQQRSYVQQWSSRGYNVAFVDGDEAKRVFGSDRYCGGMQFDDGGSVNPLAYVRGLARAAENVGARLFGNSPVKALVRDNGGWICRTSTGSVRAARVVLAANGGNAALHPAMRRTTLPLHVFQFATAPLTVAERTDILPDGGGFTDKRPYLFTARFDGHGHLISAFPMSFLVRGDAGRYREARRRIEQHFTTMTNPQIDYLWHGLARVGTSFLPELYDLGDDAFAIQACNGRGIATNTVLGVEVAAMLATGDRRHLSVQPRTPTPIRFFAGAATLPKLLMSMAYLSN